VAVDSPRIAVRVPWRVLRAAGGRATAEGRSISEVVRDLLAGYAAGVSSIDPAGRQEIRRLVRMSDKQREDYYLRSLRNLELVRNQAPAGSR
jgi:hypothetical protein